MDAAQRLAINLYYPGCLSLERKRATADTISIWVRPADMRAAYTRRSWTNAEDRILLELNSPTAAAEELGRTVQSCNLRLWRLRTGQAPIPSDQ
ncbi:hypothetical protein [Streptomyces sp. DG2A-72]|uniref:hypothetical protein n=1 Tax=Streptomyces sp. DG2A-72 TaxID=3051386 RepID=UPI0034642D74